MSDRIIARANRMFSRATDIIARAQKLLNSVSAQAVDASPVRKVRPGKVVEAPVAALVNKVRRAVEQAAPAPAAAKKARRSVFLEDNEVVATPPVKKSRRTSVPVEEAPVPVAKKTRREQVDIEDAPPVRRVKAAKDALPVLMKKGSAVKLPKTADLEMRPTKAPKNVRIQVEDDFPDL